MRENWRKSKLSRFSIIFLIARKLRELQLGAPAQAGGLRCADDVYQENAFLIKLIILNKSCLPLPCCQKHEGPVTTRGLKEQLAEDTNTSRGM